MLNNTTLELSRTRLTKPFELLMNLSQAEAKKVCAGLRSQIVIEGQETSGLGYGTIYSGHEYTSARAGVVGGIGRKGVKRHPFMR